MNAKEFLSKENQFKDDMSFGYVVNIMEAYLSHNKLSESPVPAQRSEGWVKVGEATIEKRIRYNVWDGLIVTDAYFDLDGIWKMTQTGESCKFNITHICPLPDPPTIK